MKTFYCYTRVWPLCFISSNRWLPNNMNGSEVPTLGLYYWLKRDTNLAWVESTMSSFVADTDGARRVHQILKLACKQTQCRSSCVRVFFFLRFLTWTRFSSLPSDGENTEPLSIFRVSWNVNLWSVEWIRIMRLDRVTVNNHDAT